MVHSTKETGGPPKLSEGPSKTFGGVHSWWTPPVNWWFPNLYGGTSKRTWRCGWRTLQNQLATFLPFVGHI